MLKVVTEVWMSLRGVEENRQKPEGAVKREICLAQGHGQGLLVRITIKEVLTVCEKEKKICIVQ